MDSVTAAEIAKLETMTVSKLVEKFESLVGERCRSRNKRYPIRRIACDFRPTQRVASRNGR